jgi:AcrR family transcriptional regulator
MNAARRTPSKPDLAAAAPERVLRVAEALFLQHGYNATTIRQIAAASNVSNATIVKYFGGKPGLFVAMVGQATERLIGATAVEFGDLPGPGLTLWGGAVLRLLLEPQLVLAARHLYGDMALQPGLGQAYFAAGPAKLAASLARQLQRWAQIGQLPDQDFFAAAQWFMHLLGGGIYQRVMIGIEAAPDNAAIDAAVAEATRIFLAAFGQAAGGLRPRGDNHTPAHPDD